MKLKLFAFAALATLSLGAGIAQAEQPLVEAKNQILVKPTTPQVAYPPKCGDPIFPRFCRRW